MKSGVTIIKNLVIPDEVKDKVLSCLIQLLPNGVTQLSLNWENYFEQPIRVRKAVLLKSLDTTKFPTVEFMKEFFLKERRTVVSYLIRWINWMSYQPLPNPKTIPDYNGLFLGWQGILKETFEALTPNQQFRVWNQHVEYQTLLIHLVSDETLPLLINNIAKNYNKDRVLAVLERRMKHEPEAGALLRSHLESEVA